MRVLVQIKDIDIIELYVQVLVDGFEGAPDPNIILELNGHRLVGERLEETVDLKNSLVKFAPSPPRSHIT